MVVRGRGGRGILPPFNPRAKDHAMTGHQRAAVKRLCSRLGVPEYAVRIEESHDGLRCLIRTKRRSAAFRIEPDGRTAALRREDRRA